VVHFAPMTPHLEARLGSLVAAGGVIWTANIATKNFTSLDNLLLPSGPLELCAIGILIWLHAKWRGSVTVR
jgi:hypothetical protein